MPGGSLGRCDCQVVHFGGNMGCLAFSLSLQFFPDMVFCGVVR